MKRPLVHCVLGSALLCVATLSPSAETSASTIEQPSSGATSASPYAAPSAFVAKQAAAAPRSRASWNPNVQCRATLTTLRHLLGDKRNRLGGATYRDGGFKPGIPDRRALHPPCDVNQTTTFVQMNRVTVGSCKKINEDGDWTCTLVDKTTPPSRPDDMKSLHIETDKNFRVRAGWSIPPGYVEINVQGFVFWDPGHTEAAWHNHTGWELHSFTAWRRSAQKSTSPMPTSMSSVGCHMGLSPTIA